MPEYKLKSYEVRCDYCDKIIDTQDDQGFLVMESLNKYYCRIECMEDEKDDRTPYTDYLEYIKKNQYEDWFREYHKIWLELLG